MKTSHDSDLDDNIYYSCHTVAEILFKVSAAIIVYIAYNNNNNKSII